MNQKSQIRKSEIKEYVEELIKIPTSDATGLTEFEKTFSDEEWDYFLELMREKQDLYSKGLLDVPDPLAG